jgi:ribonuclease E
MGDQPAVLGHDMVPEAAAGELPAAEDIDGEDDDSADASTENGAAAPDGSAEDSELNRRRRRRGRRGGRRRRHTDRDGDDANRPDSDHGDGIPALAGETPTEGDDHAADERPRSDQDRSDQAETGRIEPDHSVPVQAALFETEPASVNGEPLSDTEAEPAMPVDPVSQPAAPSLPEPAVRTADKNTDDDTPPLPVTSGATPEAIEAETPAGPPRRGWWQRLTTRE